MDDGEVAVGLPLPPSPLIGRDGELAAARALLGQARLVTLVGTGGTGKTRLAQELALDLGDEYPDGAAFVDLAPLGDPDQVLPAVARTLGLRDAGGQPLTVTLHHHLRDRHLLLVLDNLEHLPGAAGAIAELLARCHGVRVLATSRAPLHAPGEHLLPVEPLPVPDPRDLPAPAELARTPSVALFVARTRAAQPDFTLDDTNSRTVAEICLVLDGLPLALELAAAQVRAYGLDEVRSRTRNRFELLHLPRRAVTPRHRSLAAALRWSVDLLDDDVRATFARLSIFTGGWTADAAHAVCGADMLPALAELVDQSLIVATRTGAGVRYRMLETLREYAAALLEEAGESEELRRRHLAWCRRLAVGVYLGPLAGDEITSVDRVEAEFDNVRAALEGVPAEETAAGLKMARKLYFFWDVRGYLGEGRRHLERLLARPESHADPAARAAGLDALGMMLLWQDDHAGTRAALAESIALSERIGDTERVAWSTSTIMFSKFMTGEVAPAEPLAEEAVAVARRAGVPGTVSRTTCALGVVRMAQGRSAESTALLQESLQIAVEMGMLWGRGKMTYFLGWGAFLAGDHATALRLARDSAAAFLPIGGGRCPTRWTCWPASPPHAASPAPPCACSPRRPGCARPGDPAATGTCTPIATPPNGSPGPRSARRPPRESSGRSTPCRSSRSAAPRWQPIRASHPAASRRARSRWLAWSRTG